jgi:hypothetical protein
MTVFRTLITPEPSKKQLKPGSHVLFIGSCFAEHVGKRMKDYCFNSIINPFGTLYNPVSISNAITILIKKKLFIETDLHYSGNKWFSFYHNTGFSHDNTEECLQKINKAVKEAASFFTKTDYIFITPGTAWVYEYKKNRQVVSNCHKLPANQFIRRRLTMEEVVAVFNAMIKQIRSVLPAVTLVFSVSPVRHWKDGAHGNQLSKSVLLLAIDEVVKNNQATEYFNSYELVMDDLRDYRFYASDMIHLNQPCIDYIWDNFVKTYFSEEAQQYIKDIHQLVTDCKHRPVDILSKEYACFLNKTYQKLVSVSKRYHQNDFRRYQEDLQEKMKKIN